MPKWGSSKYYCSHCLEGKNIHGSTGSDYLLGKDQSTVHIVQHRQGYIPACPRLSNPIHQHPVPELQHATILGATKSLAKKWAKDIPRWTSQF
jgi:hypothetical protein